MKKILASVFFVLLFQVNAFCQTDSAVIKNAVSKLKTLLTDHITEKAYLHFDRPYLCYVAGEVMYFKAYVIKGERHDLSNISGMLHVDLINNKNTVIQTELIELNNGLGWGDFALPDTLPKGSYRIRAYTRWMLNEKTPNYFEQYISVSSVNNVDRATSTIKQETQPAIQFFPEGGNLVSNIHSKVAFKAIGTNGLGVEVNGTILDNENTEVARITSTHLGMGVFEFTPQTGKKYKAKLTFADGSQNVIDLPAAEESGITLSVNTDDAAMVSIEIKANKPYYEKNLNKELNLIIYWSGSVKTINTKLDNPILGVDLPASTFRTGIMQISLLSQTGEPLCERLSFIQNPGLLNLSLNTNKTTYARRENVQLNLNAQNKDGNNVNGFFSVSVIDESKILVDDNAENTMLSYFLLTSDLKGNIEKPNYYFSNITKQTRANLDVLMLTQGYRRFVWKKLLNENIAANTYQPEQYMDLSGSLTTKSGVPVANAKIILLPLGQTEKTDEKGHFIFSKVNYKSGTQFIFKTPSSSGKNAVILTLDKAATDLPVDAPSAIASTYNGNTDILASLQNNQVQGIVTASSASEKVLLKSDKNEKLIGPKRNDNYRSASIAGPGHADQVIHGDAIKNFALLSSGLNGLAHGIGFVQGVPYLLDSKLVTGSAASISQTMMVDIDGTILPPGSGIDDINPASVETVEILKADNASIYGENSNGGVIVITTRQMLTNETVLSKETAPGIFVVTPPGFYKAREFYTPVYDPAVPPGKIPDTRTTIFWKPDITTDTKGNAVFQYSNADGTGIYRIVVEGIDENGNIGRQVLRYKVQ